MCLHKRILRGIITLLLIIAIEHLEVQFEVAMCTGINVGDHTSVQSLVRRLVVNTANGGLRSLVART